MSSRMKLPGRLLILVVLFATFFFFAFQKAEAQNSSSYSSQQINPYTLPLTNPDVPKNMHTLTQIALIDILSAFNCQLVGVDLVNPEQKCLGIDPKTNAIGFVDKGGGLVGALGHMITLTFIPPLHTSDYIAYIQERFGITKPAFAQNAPECKGGMGFCGLRPLLDIWIIFRNMAYFLFVVIFVFIGLGIMLRVKIDPRTVMSIENQIPKIIIALILVTFSFAISGVLIDVMYLIIYMIFNLFIPVVNQDAARKIADAQRTFNGDAAAAVFNNLIGFWDIVTASAASWNQFVSSLLGAIGIYQQLTNFPLVGGVFRIFLDGITGIFITCMVLFAMFRLWFTLIKNYILFLVNVVLAPLWIVAGVIPGAPFSFGTWFRTIFSQLSVYPTTILLFLIAKVFMDAFGNTSYTDYFIPPLMGDPGNPSYLGALIGLGFIFMTPSVVDMAKDVFKASAFKYSSAIGQAVGAGAGQPIGIGKGIAQTHLAAEETIMTNHGWDTRGIPKALFGRLTGSGR